MKLGGYCYSRNSTLIAAGRKPAALHEAAESQSILSVLPMMLICGLAGIVAMA